MKKILIGLLTMIMLAGMTGSVLAAPSISQIIPENPTLISGNLQEGEVLVVQNVDPQSYENEKVAEVVEKVNDDDIILTVKVLLSELEVDTEQEFKSENGKKVNPTLFEQITPFVDLVIKEGDTVKYEVEGEIKASVVIEAAKEMDQGSLLLMQIDPNTGEVFFIMPESVDPVTGEVVATFPTLGPVTVMKPVDIVTKDTAPEKYDNQRVAKTVKMFKDKSSDIELSDILKFLKKNSQVRWKRISPSAVSSGSAKAQVLSVGLVNLGMGDGNWSNLLDFAELVAGNSQKKAAAIYVAESTVKEKDDAAEAEELTELQITEDITVQVEDYSTVMGFTDLAIKYGKGDYLYDMSGTFDAEVKCDLSRVDWKRMVRSAYPDVDLEEVDKDLSLLEELEPFVLKDSFVMQLNPITGDMEYIYEPEVYFANPEKEIDRTGGSTYVWNVDEEERRTEEVPNLVISAEYKSMGPFAIFMPKEAVATPEKGIPCWIWILILLLIVIAAYMYIRKQREKKKH